MRQLDTRIYCARSGIPLLVSRSVGVRTARPHWCLEAGTSRPHPGQIPQSVTALKITCVRTGGWWIAPLHLALTTLLAACHATSAVAENTNLMIKPPVALPGGLSLHPVITSVTKTQDVATVEWFGIQGPYQLLHATSPNANVWDSLAKPTFGTALSVPLPGDLGFFRVLGGRPVSTSETGGTVNYIGDASCLDCHGPTHQAWGQTGHARAFESLKAVNQQTNSSCLICHTVGYGTPLGFKDEATTPHLAGVQCENCHGPGASHIANIRDVSVRPKVTVAAEVCGGCHNYHHATFAEWKQSPHSVTNADVSDSILAQGESRMLSCGVCHSAAVRNALLAQLVKPSTPLPSRVDAAFFPVTCAVCHDSHQNMAQPPQLPNPQLRNPLYSTNNFSYNTSTNTTFAAQYDPDIQLCAQCHNLRGAGWQDTSRSPHHSPQYNILIGQGGYDLGNRILGTHGRSIDNQCVHCHTHPLPAPGAASNPQQPNYTGHTFEVSFDGCAICHGSVEAAQGALASAQASIKSQITELTALLNNWATNKAPAELQTKYEKLAWEYTTPGDLSNPTNNPDLAGPTTAEQARVPDAIKQARLNLYLVQYDGSFGAHNRGYARYLLNVATTNLNVELSKP